MPERLSSPSQSPAKPAVVIFHVPEVVSRLSNCLPYTGIEVVAATSDAQVARDAMGKSDLLITDCNVAGRAMGSGRNKRIIVLSDKSDRLAEVLGAGADNLLPTNVDPNLLSAYIQAILRRKPMAESRTATIGNLTVDLENRKVIVDDQETQIPKKPWEVLKYLLDHRGSLVTNREILSHVWGPNHNDSGTVRVIMMRLNRIIGPGIINRTNFGYLIPKEEDPV